MFDIIAIGSTTRDVFLKVAAPLVNLKNAPYRRTIVLPLGKKIEAEDIYFSVGGNALNASVTFSREGYKTALAAKIGKDVEAGEMLKRLKKEKISIDLVKKDEHLPTAYSVILIQGGDRALISYPGASHGLTLKDFNFSRMKSKWWYVSLSGESYRILPALLDFAGKNQIQVALNPTGYHISKVGKKLRQHLSKAALLILNENEAATLTGISFKSPDKVFRKIDEMMPGIAVVTSGKQGVSVSDGRVIYRAGVFPTKVVNRTGAGDAFGSGFVAGMLERGERCEKGICRPVNIEYAIRLATANAASVMEKVGASEGALTEKNFKNQKRWQTLKINVRKLA